MTNGDKQQFLPSIRDRVDRGFEEMIGRMINQEQGSRYKTDPEESMSNSMAKKIEIKLLKANSDRSHNSDKNPSIENKIPEPEIELGLQSTDRVRSKGELEPPALDVELFRKFSPTPSSSKKSLPSEGEDKCLVGDLLKKNPPNSLAVGDLSIIVEEENERLSKNMSLVQTHSPFESLVLEVIKHYRKNIFSVMFPFYKLDELETFQSHQNIDSIEGMKAQQSILNLKLFRFETMIPSLTPVEVTRALCDLSLYERWHSSVHEAAVKLKISSENSCVCYERHRRVV